jgi:hypothetical protein
MNTKLKKNWRKILPYKSQLTSIKDIEKRNNKFHSLPVANRRKEIALDVIGLVANGDITASSRNYWGEDLDLIRENSATPKELQDNLLNQHTGCDVCARGATMLSTVRLGNKLDPGDDWLDNGCTRNQKHFTLNMYTAMESIYEYGYNPYNHNTSENLLNIFLQVVYTGRYHRDNITDYLKRIRTKS